MKTHTWLFAALLGASLLVPRAGWSVGFADELDLPAIISPLAQHRLINGLAFAGKRLVAVGERGHILVSDEQGRHWRQVADPVRSDLVAVSFANARKGWAVGHDGVVLTTSDGGNTWTKQFDGRQAARAMADYYAEHPPAIAAGSHDSAAAIMRDVKRDLAQGPDKPFLDVCFENERTGFIVGAFNLIFRTEDGGRHWLPWFDRTDNPRRLHLYSVREIAGEWYVVGEQGLVMKLDRKAERFRALPTPYHGTFFGIVGNARALLVYGLRGTLLRSTDGGGHWQPVDSGLRVALTASTVMPDGRIVIVSQAGDVLVSRDDGASFVHQTVAQPLPAAAVLAAGADELITGGLRGVAIETFKSPEQP